MANIQPLANTNMPKNENLQMFQDTYTKPSEHISPLTNTEISTNIFVVVAVDEHLS